MIAGSEFVSRYAGKGLPAWEAAALAIARAEGTTPWPWSPLTLQTADGAHAAVLQVRTDVLSIGPIEDALRLPMLPNAAQGILNLSGNLLPTPWLTYQIWRQAAVRLEPIAMVPNLGANLLQYQAHSKAIDAQLRSVNYAGKGIVSGHKKAVVISNIAKPGKVLIFGFYRPSPPAPDVFDDGTSIDNGSNTRQPIQPRSNVHGDFYVDYSHGIHEVHPECVVDGARMRTIDLYQHPLLSALVSNETASGRLSSSANGPPAPLRVPRYPSSVKPPTEGAVAMFREQVLVDVASYPNATDEGLQALVDAGENV